MKQKKTSAPGVYLLDDGRYWLLVTTTDPTTGRRAQKEATIEAPSVEAAAEVRASLLEQLRREVRTAATTVPTLADYAEQWIKRKAQRNRPSTINQKICDLGRRILPVLGEVPVVDLRRSHVEDWVIWAQAQRTRNGEPYAHDTLNGWWRVLGSLLRDAAADYQFADPMRRVEPPKGKRKNVTERRTLGPEGLASLMDSVRTHFPEWALEAELVVLSGLRPSELYALEAGDLDLQNGLVHVRRSVDLRTGRAVVSEPKTGVAREVALPAGLTETLRDRFGESDPEAILFPNRNGGYRGKSALYNVLRRAGEAAGLDVRVGAKALRRSFVTVTRLAGNDLATIQSNVGHSSDEMTDRYTGVPRAERAKMADALESAVKAARPDTTE